MHQVMIHPATYDTCHKAVNRAFALFPLDMAGKKVVIKPNVLRMSTADEHIVTHPALLRAVVDRVESLSPQEIVVGEHLQHFAVVDHHAIRLGGRRGPLGGLIHGGE
jgi:uncharacterized protein (DUF362 family)